MLTIRTIKRIFIAIIGGTVLLIGVAMIILPGPAFIVIPSGLAILALEFAWAKHWLHKTREYIDKAKNRVMRPRPSADPQQRPEPATSGR